MYQISRYDFDINSRKLKFRETYSITYPTIDRAENIVADLMEAQAIREDDEGLEFDGDIHCYAISDLPTFLDGSRNGEEVQFTLYVNADFCFEVVNILEEWCKESNIPFKAF